jgi:DNA-binding PadR family transcriptional regulator
MSVRYGVLGLLATKDMHGYELRSRFEALTGGFWQLNFGQVYTTLDRLEREGLVERSGTGAGAVDAAADRKVFRITGKGRSRLDEWLQLPVAHPRALRDDLFVRLLFCDRSSPDSILRMIARHRDVYQLQMRRLSKRKHELLKLDIAEPLSVTELLLDAALFHAEAELRWLSHVEQKVLARWSPPPKRRRA